MEGLIYACFFCGMPNVKSKSRDAARMLYFNTDKSQKEIAELCKVSERTMSRWVSSENWAELKTSHHLSRDKAVNSLLSQIQELNNAILSREEGSRYATSKEADILTKLTKQISYLDKDLKLKDYVTVLQEEVSWIKEIDLEFAKKLTDFQYEFLAFKAVSA